MVWRSSGNWSARWSGRATCGSGSAPGSGWRSAVRGPVYMVGRKSVKVLPRPGVLRKVSSPPSSCASSRLMARPRPVPPYLRLVLASACWKASNTIFCFSTGMPTPVSVTSKATTELAWLSATLSVRQPVWAGTTRSRTLPWAVNFSALLTAGSSGSAAGAWNR